ncbi:hypothetical protein [Nitrosospira sp. Is2]|uniref:hypothetical protein n=1 Tax=Nitrosospira sp. Is2 TaxID=3080532 RepID=UPI00295514A2|nr:hypothetical protein [Nitrosospira sp. Is2]WON74049.1 hypothetical protein R5L00_00730 [Nitrosospira sp. Is2]
MSERFELYRFSLLSNVNGDPFELGKTRQIPGIDEAAFLPDMRPEVGTGLSRASCPGANHFLPLAALLPVQVWAVRGTRIQKNAKIAGFFLGSQERGLPLPRSLERTDC